MTLDELVAAERAQARPPSQVQADGWARVERAVVAGRVVQVGDPVAALARSFVPRWPLAIVGVVLVAIGITGMPASAPARAEVAAPGLSSMPSPVVSAPVVSAPVVSAPVVAASPVPAEPIASPSAPTVARAPMPRARRLPRASVDTLALELAIVRRAQSALADGDVASALAIADEHATRFPHGALAPERDATRAIARCRLGDDDPTAIADAFAATHPRSSYLARVRRSCARIDGDTDPRGAGHQAQ